MKKLFYVLLLAVGLMFTSARGAPVCSSLISENGVSLLVTGNAITGAEMIQINTEVFCRPNLVAGVVQPTVIPIRTELITETTTTNAISQTESQEGVQTKKGYVVASDMNQGQKMQGVLNNDIDFIIHKNLESGGGIPAEETVCSESNFLPQATRTLFLARI